MSTARFTSLGRLLLVLLALLVGGSPAVAAPASARGSGVYANATKHTLAEPFWGFWVEHDGPSLLGLPVSQSVKSGADQVQYFEYGVLTTHGGRVQRAEAGALLKAHLDAKLASAATPIGDGSAPGPLPATPPADASSTPAAALVALIKTFVSEHGGSDRFGKALGFPFVHGDVVARWYAYGRIEVSISSKPAAQQVAVGRELAQALGVKMGPVKRTGRPLLDLSRPGAGYFVGDGALPEAAGAFQPTRITIPSLSLDAAIENLDIVNGVMGIPVNAWNVGWYHQLNAPGLTGNAVMAGHVDWWGIGPTVFANLASIQTGAMIYVFDANGEGATYAVSSVDSVPVDTPPGPVIGSTEVPTLTLITCTGAFDGAEYNARLIVKATRV
jgi:LPXTG-site transpeptidase (sortase) family protein